MSGERVVFSQYFLGDHGVEVIGRSHELVLVGPAAVRRAHQHVFFSLRDSTPEVTMDIADRNAPGIAEYIRLKSMEITDRAMLTRGASVIRGQSIIVNLPGSPRAVKECLGFIMGGLEHGIKVLRGGVYECARD